MALDLDQNPLATELANILSSGPKPVKFTTKLTLHTTALDIPIAKLVSKDRVKDFVNTVGDVIHVEFTMPLGDYAYNLFPYRNNLEITESRQQLSGSGSDVTPNTPILLERFKAIFMPQNKKIEATEYKHADQQSMNLVEVVTVHLQLINTSLEILRTVTIGGTIQNEKPEDILRAVLGSECLKVTVAGKPSIDALDIVAADNTEVKKNFIMDHGTHLLALPTNMQERQGGVYNAGIGTYVQAYKGKTILYVYPLYKTQVPKSNVPSIIFYSVPKSKYPTLDVTYRTDGLITYIVGTGDKEYKDDAEVGFMNKGVGFRMVDANAIMKQPFIMTKDGPVGARAQLNTEITSKLRTDGNNYIPFAEQAISANPFTQISRVRSSSGGTLTFHWQNPDISLLYPGIPIKVVFMNVMKRVEVLGTVLHIHELTQMSGKGMLGGLYGTTAMITVFIDKLPEALK